MFVFHSLMYTVIPALATVKPQKMKMILTQNLLVNSFRISNNWDFKIQAKVFMSILKHLCRFDKLNCQPWKKMRNKAIYIEFTCKTANTKSIPLTCCSCCQTNPLWLCNACCAKSNLRWEEKHIIQSHLPCKINKINIFIKVRTFQ